ncbi:MAG: AhpC/TSA family protein [Tannerella sp.]|jgi:peroxiredoxin|nr:AhpC/TSA family protein [Tannerella sp.]
MEKKVFFVLAGLLCLLSCDNQKESRIVIDGTVANVEAEKVYLQKFEEKLFFVIDSADVIDGRFRFSTTASLPEIYGLTVNPQRGQLMLFLDADPVQVTLDPSEGYSNSKVTGSTEQDLYAYYLSQEDIVIEDFIRAHPQSLAATYVLYRNFSYRLTPEEIQANIQLLDSSLWKTPYVKTLNALVETLLSVAPGKPAPDFTADDPEGRPVSLSSRLGNGYVLLDFWASWCPPCRQENPHLVALYNEYKNKGFDILSVSLDRTKDAWLKGIADDNLTWTHVSDLKYWHSAPAALYGVRAIPSNFLIDRDGVIVAKNLDGNELDEKLGELFK